MSFYPTDTYHFDLLDNSPEYQKLRNLYKEEVEEVWKREGHGKFNGKIFALQESGTFNESSIKKSITLIKIEYKDFLAQKFGVPLGLIPVGVTGFVFYKSNNERKYLLGKRSHKVSSFPDHFEFIPSGSLDNGSTPDQQITRELVEESGLQEDQIKDVKFLGYVYDKSLPVLDLLFQIEVSDEPLITLNDEYSSIEALKVEELRVKLRESNSVPTSLIIFNEIIKKDKYAHISL